MQSTQASRQFNNKMRLALRASTDLKWPLKPPEPLRQEHACGQHLSLILVQKNTRVEGHRSEKT
jgi:hypothetical protein